MDSVFYDYLLNHEDWLMERILHYAVQQGYTKYTSTLKEAWRLSISGLSDSLVSSAKAENTNFELSPDQDYLKDPASLFGRVQAKRHRDRGIRLDMFLGLMKYYRQSYLDLVQESEFSPSDRQRLLLLIQRFFDRVEIGFCSTWASSENDEIIKALQKNNREMTNEKNKYLTIFESLSMPVFIVNMDGIIENMNHAAAITLNWKSVSGSQYYGKGKAQIILFGEIFPWLKKDYAKFLRSKAPQKFFETVVENLSQYFYISFSRSQDISGKFTGTIVIIEDITHRKILEKELERFATTDPLTGSKNRRAFLNLLQQELKRAKRYNKDFALMMMDIDHFKLINDTHGHDIGDKVLKLLAAKSHSVLRGSDVLGRWGGEEFILLLPETNIHQASSAAERLRGALAKSELITDSGTFVSFTVSIGLTLIKDPTLSLDEMIKKADKALYLAKQKGRNQVVLL